MKDEVETKKKNREGERMKERRELSEEDRERGVVFGYLVVVELSEKERMTLRGLNNTATQDALVNLVLQRNLSIIFLLETLASPDLLSDIRRNLGFDGVICSPYKDDCRGLGLFWRNEILVRLRNYSTNHIDVEVGAIGSAGVFRFTGIYGITATADHKSRGPPRNVAQMNRFRQALVDCDLMDMGFVGSHYTWANRFTKERLDRACQNLQWKTLYPFSRVITLPLSRSDHCLLLIDVIPEPLPSSRTPKQFRFEEMWLQHEALLSVIEQGWMTPVTGEFMGQKGVYRRCRNRVKGLCNGDGQWTSQLHEVADILINYYENIFSSESVDLTALETILNSMQAKVTEEVNRELLASYTDAEIKKALFQMHPSKSPGPDVRDILRTGRIPQESNFTHLTLIPKIKEPQLPSDLRPIALCSVVYKIASKVLANRLKGILPHIVSPLQSAFVPGRLISDNTLVATEVAHFMKKLRRQADGFFSLKLDISKAYDRLEWQYVEAVLLKLGFCQDWVNVVLATIKSVSYSVLMNGTPTGFILPTRGIRQGDTLSPYIFILCAEGLSSLISSCVQNGTIKVNPIESLAVQAINALDCDLSPLRALVADVRSLPSSSNNLSVTFAPRQANSVAHRLASLSFESEIQVEWFVTTPDSIPDALMYLRYNFFYELTSQNNRREISNTFMAGTSCPRKRIKTDVRYPTEFDPDDRISQLPDDILRHILSLLPLHEVTFLPEELGDA
ncbi:uncharacterized protein LOC133744726 [Rosa rugosa]|uniref:uncharacterized protein LOC133744726 n=1 Tax=Rosa rugosa TaxID=74645 RepID=UPI002B40F346|nr:uncharacterized protein LOC133744726 [Rosa rugosa]